MPDERFSGSGLRDDLFVLGGEPSVQLVRIGEFIPALVVDDFYAQPDSVRDAALALEFQRPSYVYPGRIAKLPPDNPSLLSAIDWIRTQVNRHYVPVAPLTCDGKRIETFDRIATDMAVTEIHPVELSADQQRPHVDPVPVFGLVYLNRKARGGTLFFEQNSIVHGHRSQAGYPAVDSPGFKLLGRLDGKFNRLVIYPGIVPHSGEIGGEWIHGEERFTYPRLTQRFAFLPAP